MTDLLSRKLKTRDGSPYLQIELAEETVCMFVDADGLHFGKMMEEVCLSPSEADNIASLLRQWANKGILIEEDE